MSAIYEALEKATLASDGAMGTMLQDRGLTDGGAPELWNVERPEEIEAVLEAYAAAGANFITTNTFGGTAGRLAMHGLEDRLAELNKAGAAIARKVADRHAGCFVMGDIGPSGELMEPMGTLTPESGKALFAAQISALVAGGVDAATAVAGGGGTIDLDHFNVALYNLGKYGRNRGNLVALAPSDQAARILERVCAFFVFPQLDEEVRVEQSMAALVGERAAAAAVHHRILRRIELRVDEQFLGPLLTDVDQAQAILAEVQKLIGKPELHIHEEFDFDRRGLLGQQTVTLEGLLRDVVELVLLEPPPAQEQWAF
jgi:hypothetical protein